MNGRLAAPVRRKCLWQPTNGRVIPPTVLIGILNGIPVRVFDNKIFTLSVCSSFRGILWRVISVIRKIK